MEPENKQMTCEKKNDIFSLFFTTNTMYVTETLNPGNGFKKGS